jgi:hypothetical protein
MNRGITCGLRLKVILRLAKGEADFCGDDLDCLRSKLRMGFDAGLDSRAAESKLWQAFRRILDTFDGELDLARIAAKFLTQANRRGVVQMGPADLHNAVEASAVCSARFRDESEQARDSC